MSSRMIFVESNTTGSGMVALATATRLGLRPLLLANDASRYAGLAATGAEAVRCDTNDGDALECTVAGCGDELAGITTTSDFYLATVADLAARHGLPGNPPDVVRRCRDKAATRRVLAGAGVPQPKFAVVGESGPALEWQREVMLPCVVKPVDESGSEDVLLCRSEPEVRAQLKRVLSKRTNARGQPAARVALVEEYLDGPEYSVEMFSTAGRAHFVGITAKVVGGAPCFVELGHHYPATLEPGAADRTVALVTAALEAVGVREGPTHTEVRWTPTGPAVVEINVRLAGGMIPELIRLTEGVDLVEQQVRAAAGLSVDLRHVPTQAPSAGIRFLVASGPGLLREITGADGARALPGIAQVQLRPMAGLTVSPPRSAYDRLGHVIALGEDPREVESRLDLAVDAIRMTITPLAEVGIRPDA
jgi:S-sulfo-L-cysteine synthase (3-phospho-L-serine-dependent)